MSELSEKEIIEECENLANNAYHELGDCWDEEYSREAICGLLDLYNIQRKMLNDAFDRGWIHKDKLREKIDKIDELRNVDGITYDHIILEIEELLEEE